MSWSCQWSLPLTLEFRFHRVKTMHNAWIFFPPISLLNISVYRLQPRLFIDSLPYLKKTQKDHKKLRFRILIKIDDCKLNLYVSSSHSRTYSIYVLGFINYDTYMSWSCQWSLISLITGNKVKKTHKPRYCEKEKDKANKRNLICNHQSLLKFIIF
jgi:hypothetical protein